MTPERRATAFLGLAEEIVNSDPVIGVYAACEWDDLHENGKVWIAAIVAEATARANQSCLPSGRIEGTDAPARDDGRGVSPSVVTTTLIGGVFFLPDAVGEPHSAMAIDFFPGVFGEPPKIIKIEPDLFHDVTEATRLYLFDRGNLIRLKTWRDFIVADLSEPRVLILIRPEDWIDLHCHGSMLSVVGGTPTVAGGGGAASRSPEGQRP